MTDDEIAHEAKIRARYVDCAEEIMRRRDRNPDLYQRDQRLAAMIGEAVVAALTRPDTTAVIRQRRPLDDVFDEHQARLAEIRAQGEEGMRAIKERIEALADRWQVKPWLQ